MGDSITQAELKELLEYNPETGGFKWRARGRGRRPDGRAGRVAGGGYIQIKIQGRLYRAHRLAWLYVHGRWPEHQIDHANGDTADNRIGNLRDVPGSVNLRNSFRRASNTSGHTGVYWYKTTGKWLVRIYTRPCHRKHVGYFDHLEEAIAARQEAEREYGLAGRHGMPRAQES